MRDQVYSPDPARRSLGYFGSLPEPPQRRHFFGGQQPQEPLARLVLQPWHWPVPLQTTHFDLMFLFSRW